MGAVGGHDRAHADGAGAERWLHLIGMAVFGMLHAVVRTLLIFAIALPFFNVDFGRRTG